MIIVIIYHTSISKENQGVISVADAEMEGEGNLEK
jgi:hypothetical protein